MSGFSLSRFISTHWKGRCNMLVRKIIGALIGGAIGFGIGYLGRCSGGVG
jgi:hypothetical protein